MNRVPISAASILPGSGACEDCLPLGLSAHLRARLRLLAVHRIQVAHGETLLHAGAAFRHLYAVCKGSFKSVFLGEDGGQQIIAFHWPRQLLGLSGYAEKACLTDLIALEPTEAYEFSWHAIEALARESPEFLEHLLDSMSERLALAKRDQFMLGSMCSTQKIAYFLLQMAAHAPACGLAAGSFALPMTREDIGSYLGLTMETVSRLLSQLSKAGVVLIDRKRVTLRKSDVLQAWLDGETKPFAWKSPIRV